VIECAGISNLDSYLAHTNAPCILDTRNLSPEQPATREWGPEGWFLSRLTRITEIGPVHPFGVEPPSNPILFGNSPLR
jgi:hypothetical protein